MKFPKLFVAALPLLLLSACASDSSRNEATGSAAAGRSGAAPGSTATSGAGAASHRSVADAVSARVVLFDFDSDELRRDALPVIESWAAYLIANPQAHVRLAGHADERGTREYNVGLGERRGNAVERALMARGASSKQVDVISLGEEHPVDPGHNETAWAQNRRVELTD